MTTTPKVLNSQTVYSCGLFDVISENLQWPDGMTVERQTVVHPGAAATLVFEDPDTVVIVKQYRRSIGAELLEVVAGVLHAGEDPTAAALREVEEEIGMKPQRIEPLLTFHPSPGMLSEKLHLFVAWNLKAGEQQLDADERLEVIRLPFAQLRESVKRGDIVDGKTLLLVSHLVAFPPSWRHEIGK